MHDLCRTLRQSGDDLHARRTVADDAHAGAVDLSSAIAAQVSDELVFPGQIKVTVIRAFEAIATAN